MDLHVTTDKLQIGRSSAADIDSVINWGEFVKATGVPVNFGSQRVAFASAATGDALDAPGANNFKSMISATWRNKHASLACDVEVILDQNATDFSIWKETLQPGETLEYIQGIGFFRGGPTAPDTRLLTNVETDDSQRIFQCAIKGHSTLHTFVCISGTAYYIYVGRAAQDITPKFVEFHITSAGAGTDTKEVGLFSTPNAPSKSAQTLTKIVATGTVDAGTSTGVKRNTSAFATLVPKGTHLWAALRTALATTQPTTGGLAADMSQGHILTTTGGGALTGLSSASGALVAVATVTVAPELRVTMD